MIKILKYLIFVLILVYLPMWTQINLFLGSVGNDKPPITNIENLELRQLIKSKTGVDIETFKITESDRPFGMMIGIPGKPQLLLSRGLYDSFTSDEMEYVVLHEAGHYTRAHSVKELLIGLVLLVAGILVLRQIPNPIPGVMVAIIMGLVFGVAMIRLGVHNELEADNYSVTRMIEPEGMIRATDKFRGYYGKSLTQTNNKIVQWMFYRGNPYENRIKMANDEILRRNLL